MEIVFSAPPKGYENQTKPPCLLLFFPLLLYFYFLKRNLGAISISTKLWHKPLGPNLLQPAPSPGVTQGAILTPSTFTRVAPRAAKLP